MCGDSPRLTLCTKLCVVLHRQEFHKTTNTGIVATRCLNDSLVVVHGGSGRRDAPTLRPPLQGKAVLLFPAANAQVLTPDFARDQPITLVVPDGTWRQAVRMARRIDWMAELPRVTLPESNQRTAYHLRGSERAGGLATMEAIARALGVLEGDEVQRELERVFGLLVERTLYARGTWRNYMPTN